MACTQKELDKAIKVWQQTKAAHEAAKVKLASLAKL